MKKIFNYLSVILLTVITLYSCEEDLEKTVVAPVANGTFSLTLSSDNIILNKLNAVRDTAITFNWNNPKELYGIDTSVKYEIQMDSLTGDFSKVIGTQLTGTIKSFTDAEMNATALQLKLIPEDVGKIKVRLKATLAHGALPIYSEVDTISITPYVEYVPDELYLIGDAVASGWGWDHYPLPSEQKMTKIDDNRFELVIALNSTGKFAFITSANNWTDPAYKAATDHEPLVGGNFIPSGSANDWIGKEIGVLHGDLYRITVDFRTQKYSVVPVIPSELYLQGNAVPSNWGYPVPTEQKMTKINDHTFQLLGVELKAGALAFITSADDWTDPAYRAATVAESLINGNLVTTGVGEGEFDIMIPSDGVYDVTVDFQTQKYTIAFKANFAPPAALYIIGDATPLGWSAPDETQKFTKIGTYKFSITLPLTAWGQFAFITDQLTWTDPAYLAKTNSEPEFGGHFTPSGASNGNTGSNIIAPSISGTYTIIVDFVDGTYTLSN